MSKPVRELKTIAPDGRPDGEQPDWRREFPIDALQDNYLARRAFTRFLALTSLAFAAGQIWIAVQNWLRGRSGSREARKIASLEEIPIGGTLSFSYPDHEDSCLLVRPDATKLLAYNQACTHLSCAVIPSLDAGQLLCPCHRGVFDLATGRPLAGPPRRPLTRITLEVRQGIVYATGVERRTV